jgi:hypothetical protein
MQAHAHSHGNTTYNNVKQNSALVEGGSIFAGEGAEISIIGGFEPEETDGRRISGGRADTSGGNGLATAATKHPTDAARQIPTNAEIRKSEQNAASDVGIGQVVGSANAAHIRAPARAVSASRRAAETLQAGIGVDLSGNVAHSGGAISMDGASLSVSGVVSFAGNAATGGDGAGGAVRAVNSEIVIDGASFSGNAAKSGILRVMGSERVCEASPRG